MKATALDSSKSSLSQELIPLGDPRCLDAGKVGFKALRLAEMIQNGFPVPDGLVIPVSFFQEFCRFNDIDLSQAGGAEERIKNGRFPPGAEARLEAAARFENLAVRSSSLAEDGAEFSMAGQFDTFLGVRPKDVPQRVKDCWASCFNPAVLAYSRVHNLENIPVMGVILQQLISPDYAGVLFTIEPVTKTSENFVVEWVAGLGEQLVSGEVHPESVKISRISGPADLPPELMQPFTDLYHKALALERYFEQPLDIEWCIRENRVYILQSRPITALYGKDTVIWTNVNMMENFPHPLSPFTWSAVSLFYAYYMRIILRLLGWSKADRAQVAPLVENLTGIQGGRVYYNLDNWYEILFFFPIGKQLQKFLDYYIGQSVPFEFSAKDEYSALRKKKSGLLQKFSFWFHLVWLNLNAKGYVRRLERNFFRLRSHWRRQPYDELTPPEIINRINSLFSDFVDRYYYSGIGDIAVLIFPGLLKNLVSRWCKLPDALSPEAATASLLHGIDIDSIRPVKIMEELALGIEPNQDLRKLLRESRYQELTEKLPDDLRKIYDEFMSKFGARCYHECLIVYPTFDEKPELFWNLVKKYIQGGASFEKPTLKQESEFLKQLPWVRRRILKFVIKQSFRAIRLREQGRLIRSLLFGELRKMALALGGKLQALDYLQSPEDVFLFRKNELEDIVFGRYQFMEGIEVIREQRRTQWAACDTYDMPDLFILDAGKYYRPSTPVCVANKKQSEFRGLPVSGGKITARIRIILDPINDNSLQPGEILVTKSTDPGWTPLFRIASGLILERGGMLSHGAIVAREFGIPAITGIKDVTSILKNGDLITIDGDAGTVKNAEAKEQEP